MTQFDHPRFDETKNVKSLDRTDRRQPVASQDAVSKKAGDHTFTFGNLQNTRIADAPRTFLEWLSRLSPDPKSPMAVTVNAARNFLAENAIAASQAKARVCGLIAAEIDDRRTFIKLRELAKPTATDSEERQQIITFLKNRTTALKLPFDDSRMYATRARFFAVNNDGAIKLMLVPAEAGIIKNESSTDSATVNRSSLSATGWLLRHAPSLILNDAKSELERTADPAKKMAGTVIVNGKNLLSSLSSSNKPDMIADAFEAALAESRAHTAAIAIAVGRIRKKSGRPDFRDDKKRQKKPSTEVSSNRN